MIQFNVHKYQNGRNHSIRYADWDPKMLEMFERAGSRPTSVDKRYVFTTCVDYHPGEKYKRKKYIEIAVDEHGGISVLSPFDKSLKADDITALVPKVLNALKIYMDYGFLRWEAEDESGN